ncbi:MAG: mechanosensitive ion channel family protein [Ruminococcus sp.]|uniref:mechanosensitive ion channel family protein n=1 Tax=Ruminococcus sp. TaxID=41978 RepID=UPI0039995812
MNDFDFISALNSFNEKYLPKILIFLLVFVVGSLIVKLLLKLIRKIIDKSKIERTVITFFFSILKIVLYLIVVMTALSTIGVNVSSIITTFAAAANVGCGNYCRSCIAGITGKCGEWRSNSYK